MTPQEHKDAQQLFHASNPEISFIKNAWQVCPVCSGKGIVAYGFYFSVIPHWNNTGEETEKCRSCGGLGRVK